MNWQAELHAIVVGDLAIHRFIKLLLHTAAAPCVAPRPACGEEPSSELVTDALQGTWVLVSTEERGEAKKYSNRSMVFEKNEYRFFVKALLVRKAVVTVNVVAKPYTMDLFQQIGSTQGHVGKVVTTDTANWTVLHCSGPTRRCALSR